jgi:thiol-disulfide isomerase/thioredoxin
MRSVPCRPGGIGALILAVALLAPSAARTASDTYDWYEGADGYEQALSIAKEGDRPLFLLFSVGWCGYCRALKKDYLDRRPVDDFIADHLRVDVNPEKGREERAVADRYGVRGYPTFLVLFPGQEKPYRIGPFHRPKDDTPEEFVEEMKQALAWCHWKRGSGLADDKEYRAAQPHFEAALALVPAYKAAREGLDRVRQELARAADGAAAGAR